METPPPFNPSNFAPPPKKGKPGLVIVIVIVGLLFCCGGPLILVGGGGLWAWNKMGSFVNCAISATETRRAILAYEREKGHFPPAETWQTDIAPYFKKLLDSKKSKDEMGPFKPWNIDDSLVCVDKPSPTGIAYNEELAGKKLSEIKDPYATKMLFEVPQTGLNLHQKYAERPRSSWPVMFDKPRAWLELPVTGQMQGMDSQTIKIDTKEDSDTDTDNGKDSDGASGKDGAPGSDSKPDAPKKADKTNGDSV